jgi:opacity protein-like surface antigen
LQIGAGLTIFTVSKIRTMKKIYPVFFFVFILVFQARAQDRFMRDMASGGHETGANQIRIGYGIVSMPQFIEHSGNGTSAGMIPVSYKDITSRTTGAIALSYTRDNFALIAFGGDLVYENLQSTYTYNDGSAATLSTRYMSAMLRADIRYINTEKLLLYSSVGAGTCMTQASFDGQTKNQWLPAFHVTGIGFRYGNTVAFFGEFGFGYRGIANGGISFRF